MSLRRLVGQLLLLPILWALASLDDSLYTLVVSAAILVVWPVAVAVALVLAWLVRVAEREDHEGSAPETLVEAADNAATMALIATGIAGAGLVAILRLLEITVPGRPVLVLLGWALVLIGVPSLSWTGTLRRVWLPMLASRVRR